ncbi:ATP-dependent Clp protease proteolytic subunit [Roseateles chitinivorans]|uniref:ATP-dependent Clp protease proteolytic subunit n=1 Tax=Roseateles chitinivorans TaxID=2917965 RepID=UPI003D670E55
MMAALPLAEAGASPSDSGPPVRMHVSLCGAEPTTTEGDAATQTIVKPRGRPVGDVAVQRYFAAHRDSARLRLDASTGTVSLEGTISQATVRTLAGALEKQPVPRHLVVNSFGGNARAGMAIADLLRRHQLAMTVRGFCMSACAVYLLPAAREVHLDDAVIGLHGRPATCREQLSPWTGIRQWGLSNYLEFIKVARLDADFAAGTPRMGEAVSLSQRSDRGAMDGRARDWLVVSPSQVARLGIPVASISSTDTFDAIASDRDRSLIGGIHVY